MRNFVGKSSGSGGIVFIATEDTPVKYHMTKIYPNTQLVRVNYNLTILALN